MHDARLHRGAIGFMDDESPPFRPVINGAPLLTRIEWWPIGIFRIGGKLEEQYDRDLGIIYFNANGMVSHYEIFHGECARLQAEAIEQWKLSGYQLKDKLPTTVAFHSFLARLCDTIRDIGRIRVLHDCPVQASGPVTGIVRFSPLGPWEKP